MTTLLLARAARPGHDCRMKCCWEPSRTGSGRGTRGHRTARAVALLGLCWLGAGLACSADDDVEDDPLGGDTAAAGSASTTAGAAGRSSAEAGRGGSAGTRTSTPSSPDAEEDDANGEEPPQPSGLDDGAAEGETGIFVGMTAAHNAARAELDTDPPLPDLTWSTELASVAQDWADHLTSTECGAIEHRMPNMYGENIAMHGTTRLVAPFSPEEAVAGWNAEVACWDYGTISRTESCDMQCAQGLSSNGCGHYTQLIWRNTERVGCGYSMCEADGFTYEVWVCNYDPPGNYVGQTPY